MNNESKLLSKVIEDRSIGFILERGVTEAWFADATDKKIFIFLREHYAKYQECPSLDIITENFPAYQLLPATDPLDYFVDKLIESRRRTSIIQTIGEALTAVEKEKDHESALLEIGRAHV